MPQLLAVTHVSKRGTSLRITLPKMVDAKLGISLGDVLGFYEEDGRIMDASFLNCL
jgi:bifunctional DNA-binding transcriptional regulator/antitoxin component of YhaV-PrlF toxin-antitoxin module